jgi:S-formylglutathione hydrolase FrmB
MKRIAFLILLVSVFLFTNAATVDTVVIRSHAMQKDLKCVVIKPDSYKNKKIKYPVVYLLHGYDGWYSNWIIRVPELKDHSDKYQIIIVCPDGGYSSWYLDSPIDSTLKYETYIGREVPEYIDRHYNTIKDRKARAITGLSMGGHGALFIALRHPDLFGACGSMSGLMDLKFTSRSFELSKRIGDTVHYASNWIKYSAIHFIENYPVDSLAIIIDCGTEDPFIGTNQLLHQKMLDLKIPHDYSERPGKHDWAYWAHAVKYQLCFFREYFDKIKKQENKVHTEKRNFD